MSEDEKNIKQVIGKIFSTQKSLAKSYNQYSVEQVWRHTFGDLISQYTTGVRFSRGTLTVFINSASLKQELAMSKGKVIDRINANLKYHKVEQLIIM